MNDSIAIAEIIIFQRLRKTSQAHVEMLMHSIAEKGLLQPIIVGKRKVKNDIILIAGAHRLEACKQLGHTEIAVQFRDYESQKHARLIEIDENLMRHELNAFDRAKFLTERKKTWESIHGSPRGGDRGNQYTGGKQSEQLDMFAEFDKETRELTGLSQRTIQRDIALFNCICDEVKELIAGSWIAKSQATIRKLAEVGNMFGPEQQARATQAMVDDPKLKTPKNALGYLNSGGDENVMKRDANKIALSRLKTNFNEANREVKTGFIRYLVASPFFNEVLDQIDDEHELAKLEAKAKAKANKNAK